MTTMSTTSQGHVALGKYQTPHYSIIILNLINYLQPHPCGIRSLNQCLPTLKWFLPFNHPLLHHKTKQKHNPTLQHRGTMHDLHGTVHFNVYIKTLKWLIWHWISTLFQHYLSAWNMTLTTNINYMSFNRVANHYTFYCFTVLKVNFRPKTVVLPGFKTSNGQTF